MRVGLFSFFHNDVFEGVVVLNKSRVFSLLLVAAGYALLLAAVYYPVVFRAMVPGAPDALVPAALDTALQQLQHASGRYPLWQPWVFSGMPTVEAFSYLSGLYFPNAAIAFLHPGGMLLQLIHLLFGGVGMYLFLRHQSVAASAAWFGGAVFILNPAMTAMLVHGHGSQLMTAAYLPWLLWAAMRLMERGRLQDAGMLAILAGLQLQRSHVQIAWYSWLFMLLLVVFLSFSGRLPMRRLAARWGLLVVASLCALLISAAIWLPASGYAPWSVRGMAPGGGGSAWEYATLWSMHPIEFSTLLLPGMFGFGGITYWGFMPFTDYPHYTGIIVLLLALQGGWSLRREILGRLFLFAALLSVLLSFGRFFSPVFDLFYHAAPFFSRFRVPSMALIMFYTVAAALAAHGAGVLLNARRPEVLHKPLRWASLAFALLLVLMLMLSAGGGGENFFRSLFPPPSAGSFDLVWMVNRVRWELIEKGVLLAALFLAIAAGLLWLGIKKLIPFHFAIHLLLAAALADLAFCSLQIVSPPASSLRSASLVSAESFRPALQPDEVTLWLARQEKPMRIYPAGPLFSENKFAILGIESVGGYHPAKLARYEQFLAGTGNLASLGVLRILNVGFVLTAAPVEHPSLTLVKTGDLQLIGGAQKTWIYRLEGAMPREWTASRAVGVADDRELFSLLEGQGGEVAYVEDSSPLAGKIFSPAIIMKSERDSESALIELSAPGEALLVQSEVFYPLRWKADIDGRPVEVERVNGLLRGVVVPKGTHRVRFVYDRSIFEGARMLSFAGFGAALLMLVSGVFIGGRGSEES